MVYHPIIPVQDYLLYFAEDAAGANRSSVGSIVPVGGVGEFQWCLWWFCKKSEKDRQVVFNDCIVILVGFHVPIFLGCYKYVIKLYKTVIRKSS